MCVSYFNNGSGAEIIEENNHYPFGLKHAGYNGLSGNPSYQYKYNGKELQQESGMYDIGTKNIGKNIFEARSRGGARVYFRNGSNRATNPAEHQHREEDLTTRSGSPYFSNAEEKKTTEVSKKN